MQIEYIRSQLRIYDRLFPDKNVNRFCVIL